jgi:hypothetical protein
MSELAAAGAALLAAVSNPNPCVKSSTPILNIQDCQKELLENQDITETNKTESSLNFLQNKNKPKLQISNLAVPENDSISSSEDENDDLKEASETLTANDNRAKTLQPQSLTAPSSSFSSNLKRSFTLPRHPLFNLTNNSENRRGSSNRVKKAKRTTNSSEMKSDLISSPSKSRTTATSVRNLLTRVVKQLSAKTNGGSNSNKCDRNVEERIAEWKRRFTAEPGRVPGVIGKSLMKL